MERIFLASLRSKAKLLLLLLGLFTCLSCFSAQSTPPLRVGVLISPPFVMKEQNDYRGLAVDIWRRIALDQGWQYQFIPLSGGTDENLQLLANHQLDVIVGGISATYLRLQYVDFTRPYFLDSVIAVTHKPATNLSKVKKFASAALIYLSISFAVCFLLYINLLWIFERGKLPEFPANYWDAMKNFFWHALLRKAWSIPSTTSGKIVAALWILLTIFVFSSLNASMTSALTVALNHHNGDIESLAQLQKLTVTAVEGSSSAVIAADNGLTLVVAPTYQSAVASLLDRKTDALITNAIGADRYLKENRIQDFVVNPLILSNEEYSFALPPHSPLRHTLDLEIAKIQATRNIVPLCQKFIPTEYLDRCNL